MAQAVAEFTAAVQSDKKVPVIGLVGEIYVKYNSFSNKSVVPWLIEQGVEGVFPFRIPYNSVFRYNHS